MSTLLELQRQIEAAVRAPPPCDAPLWLSATGLAVYRNNLREGARKALLADYPVIARLVGDPCFRSLAIDYVGSYPSRSGELQDFGHALPEYLAGHFAATEFAYLAEVASLERALVDCRMDDGSPYATIDALAGVEPARYGELCLVPRANWELCCSHYPVFTIWLSNQRGADPGTLVELDSGPEYVLVRGTGEGARLQGLSAADFEFIHALRGAQTLERALQRAVSIDINFDAAVSLFQLFEWRLVSSLQPLSPR